MYLTFKSYAELESDIARNCADKWLDDKNAYLNEAEKREAALIEKYEDKIRRLEEKAELKSIIEEIHKHTVYEWKSGITLADGTGRFDMNFPDNIPQYVEDMLGGKVIKQEATKVLKIDIDGNVTTGLTKESPDKGYNYKLIREN